ncbi:MAG TPA: biosynthetic arginine decarboxylase [Thermoanaerobaculaceae bacterium]|nr:biosynthetic arginine decarboxylase [Thermoanaerobaculaceae bacterium]
MVRQKIKLKDQVSLAKWSLEEARELYNIRDWGRGFFDINEAGNIVVLPDRDKQRFLDIKEFMDDLEIRELQAPVLIRFTDLLQKRIEEIHNAFAAAIETYEYKGSHYGVYPIKVNQNKQVVEDIVEFGRPFNYGLEAGTKAELLIVLSANDNLDSLIVCNGYKDDEFIEMAMWGTKLGRKVVIIVEKPSEVDAIIRWSKQLKVRPIVGVRAKLAARGRGKWESSGGDKSKFGLFPAEILDAIEKLREAGMIDCLQVLHFHLGSQITSIQSIKDALREASRIYVEMTRLGVNMHYFDVGGGLAVDYDGSKTNFSSSANYTIEEYASDIVSALAEVCEGEAIPHPHIISESGRALVAYHSVLVVNILGSSEMHEETQMPELPAEPHEAVEAMAEVLQGMTVKNFQECYHDAMQIRDESLTLFNVGLMPLADRAMVERLFWVACHRIVKIIRSLDYVPDELEGLERFISDTYYCNFSVFQSLPDHWAVKQLFPICPIHRLGERPTRKATLGDITCDSDGKIDQFIDLHDVRNTIDLHELKARQSYYLGVFLVGAYQESLGDLHNLFGDTHTVHVSITGRGKYHIDKIIEGDRVRDVLAYMQYQKRDVMNAFRRAVEAGIEDERITLKESARVQRFLEDAFEGYTYLE